MAEPISNKLILKLHDLMVKARVLEERLIKVYKTGEAYFWIGGPGEEAFAVPLGLLINKGQGVDHDFLHFHYRCCPTLVAMGLPMTDALRLIMNKVTDPNTGGRNFSNHYCIPHWNVAPVSSPLEVQYPMAVGTAWSQKRSKAKGITVVTGGDAATAEGDFASSLIWATRPGNELPLLITVQNNRWGISTNFDSQHGEKFIADRGKAFGMRTAVLDGNDPIEVYIELEKHFKYIRKTKKPVLLEVKVSRLYGHSSADGANLRDEKCCLKSFEKKILKMGLLSKKELKDIYVKYETEAVEALELVRKEDSPCSDTIWNYTYAEEENADWRNF